MIEKLKLIFHKTRKAIDQIRKHNPKLFDSSSKVIGYIFSFITAFIPVLTLPDWIIYMLIFLFSSFILTFQWAVLINREERNIASIIQQHEKEKKILEDFYQEQTIMGELACFSHFTAQKVKEIMTTMPTTPNNQSIDTLMEFLNESLNYVEKILSKYYTKEIRASIKLNTLGSNSFMTFGRGTNNISSRGGKTKVATINKKEILIEQNYAYQRIINEQIPYFSEGDLLHLKNKINADDIFFCEYKNYFDIFKSTIIVPLRFLSKTTYTNFQREYTILGILCIDCVELIPEWSKNDISNSFAYHVIAGYADNICALIRQHLNGVKIKQKRTQKNIKYNNK